MKTAHPLRRVRVARPRQTWTDVVAAYLSTPQEYWQKENPRHATRVEASKRALSERDGLRAGDIITAVLSMASKRRIGRPAGVHVTGLPASGADQAVRLLAGLRELVSVGEVDLPQRLLEELRDHSDADQACAVDAIHILHGWPDNPGVWAAGIVSQAEGVQRLPLYKRWYPTLVGVHVVRDPRDQVRAAVGDQRRLPDGATDSDVVRRLLRATVTSFADYRAVVNDIDVLCRYEDLHSDPGNVLRRILGLLQPGVDDAKVAQAAATAVGEPAGHVRPLPEDPAQQRLLHAYLVEVVRGLGYPPDDCMGTHLPGGGLPARHVRFRPAPPGPLYQRRDSIWAPLEVSGGSVDVPGGTPVLLRFGTGDAGGLAAVESCGPDDLQALCLASNDRVDDNALRSLRGLRGLQTLDLARTRVTDEGLAHLRPLTGLQQLHLYDTHTTASGRARLAKRLPQLTMWA